MAEEPRDEPTEETANTSGQRDPKPNGNGAHLDETPETSPDSISVADKVNSLNGAGTTLGGAETAGLDDFDAFEARRIQEIINTSDRAAATRMERAALADLQTEWKQRHPERKNGYTKQHFDRMLKEMRDQQEAELRELQGMASATLDDTGQMAEFAARANGLFHNAVNENGDNVQHQVTKRRVELIHVAKDQQTGVYSVTVLVEDQPGSHQILSFRRGDLVGDATEAQRRLADAGVYVIGGKKGWELLIRYLGSGKPAADAVFQATARTGWHQDQDGNDVFVTPTEIIHAGSEAPQIIYSNPADGIEGPTQAGSYDIWKSDVCRPFLYRSAAGATALGIALLAPLAGQFGLSGGVHFFGPSRCGKSTLAALADSVYGAPGAKRYGQGWSGTANALEATFLARNDLLLTLDEIGILPDRAGLKNIVYSLANGKMKSRMDRTGRARPTHTWSTLGISTGELTLKAHAIKSKQDYPAGCEVRLADTPAINDQTNANVFDLGELARDTSAFSAFCNTTWHPAANANHGHAGRAWLQHIAAMGVHKVADIIKTGTDELTDAPEGAATLADVEGQAREVVLRFLRAAATVAYAIRVGILPPDETGDIDRGADDAATLILVALTRWKTQSWDVAGKGIDRDLANALDELRSWMAYPDAHFVDTATPDRQRHIRDVRGFEIDIDGTPAIFVLSSAFSTLGGRAVTQRLGTYLREKGLLVKTDRVEPGRGSRSALTRKIAGKSYKGFAIHRDKLLDDAEG